MAQAKPDWNFLGVEIREPLVTEANEIAAEAGLTNLRYEFCNAMIWLDALLTNILAGALQTVTIQFPDPWFKKRHAKRRMVTPEMVASIAKHLSPGGKVFVQTDIEFLAKEMFALFGVPDELETQPVEANPFPIRTEREKAVEDKGLPVYRCLFRRK